MREGQPKARLIYNPGSGQARGVPLGEIIRGLADAGFATMHDPTAGETDIDRLLEDPVDLVVVAGGDGTVRAVATRLIGRGVPLAIIPLGTANNVATALGLNGVSPQDVLKGLRKPQRRHLDVGVVNGPWGREYFLESSGVGIFADLLYAYSPEQGRSLLRAVAAAIQVLPRYQARECRLTLDGMGVSNRYLLAEAMNTPYLGMRTCLAPEADPGDGMLDVVLVPEDERIGLVAFLAQAVAGTVGSLPSVTVRRARSLGLEWDGAPIHCDEVLRGGTDLPAAAAAVEITTLPAALEVWTMFRPSKEG